MQNKKINAINIGFNNKIEINLVNKKYSLPNLAVSPPCNYFLGRETDLEKIHQALSSSETGGRLQICAIGGIGKSETALDLIKRGHQLIGDDLVEIFEKEPGNLIGTAPDILKRYMEIRGIGIVDVVHMFGSGAYRPKKNVKLVIELEAWDKDKYYDRLGLKQEKIKFFDTEITKMVIPVLPGRNVALLIESAALNEKLRIYDGYNDAKTFVDSVNKKARGEE